MTRNSRELSQFASFVDVRDATQNIGLTTSLVMQGGVGIGSTVGGYLAAATSRGATDPLISFSETYLLNDVTIEADLNVTGNLISSGILTTTDLLVTGITTLSRDTGLGTVHIGQESTSVAIASATSGSLNFGVGPGGGTTLSQDGIAKATVVIDNTEIADQEVIALQVFGKTHFEGFANANSGTAQTDFVVAPQALYLSPVTVLDGVDIIGINTISTGATSIRPRLRVLSQKYAMDPDIPQSEDPGLAAIYTDGGLEVEQWGRVGYGLSVLENIRVGYNLATGLYRENGEAAESQFFGDVRFQVPHLSVGLVTSSLRYDDPYTETRINLSGSVIESDVLPFVDNYAGIGTEDSRWSRGFFLDVLDVRNSSNSGLIQSELLNVGVAATLGITTIVGSGGTDFQEVYLTVGPGKAVFRSIENELYFYSSGISTFVGDFNILNDAGGPANAYIQTSFHTQQLDVTRLDNTTAEFDPQFIYPVMSPSNQTNTTSGEIIYVNPGFYLDAFSTSLYVHNNLNVLGTSINATTEYSNLTFDLINFGVESLKIGGGAAYITMGQDTVTGVATISNFVTEVNRLRLSENEVQASTGNTSIYLEDDTLITTVGKVAVGGTSIRMLTNVADIADSPTQCTLFNAGVNVVIGAEDIGITTIRNARTILDGILELGANAVDGTSNIHADGGYAAIQIGAAATNVSVTGDLVVGSGDIQQGLGITNIRMLGNNKTILFGDLEIRGNDILSSDGSVNITMFDAQEQTSFTGAIRVEGNEVRAGTGDTNITLQGNSSTIFAGAIQVNGNAIRASNGQDNILLDSDFLTEFTGDIRVGGAGTIQAGDGTICITLEGGTGNVAIASDVSANSAFFNGLEARLNVQDVNVRDNLVTIGLIEDPTTEGNLIPPNVGLGNSGDVGILMARYDVGLSTHKYAGIFYDNSAGRVAIRTDVEDDLIGVGRDRKLSLNGLPSELEVQNLYVNLNTTLGIKTIFEAGSTNTGEEVIDVLNIVNVEIDGGVYA